jgi:AraC-like DNA-binding protein
MKYGFSATSLFGPLLVSTIEETRDEGPFPKPAGFLLCLVKRGRTVVEGPSADAALPCRGSQVLVLARAREAAGPALSACREGALVLTLAFDRDPLASLRERLEAPRGNPILAEGALWPEEGRFRILEPENADLEAFENLPPILAREASRVAEKGAGEGPAAELVAGGALLAVLAGLARAPEAGRAGEGPGSSPGRGPWSVGDVMAWIDTHYEDNFSLEDMVSRCAMNTSDFARRFKAAAGCPLFEYLNRRRVARAALLLRDGDLPIIEIAYSVGYNNLSFFNRYFRRLMGRSPSDYRRSSR